MIRTQVTEDRSPALGGTRLLLGSGLLAIALLTGLLSRGELTVGWLISSVLGVAVFVFVVETPKDSWQFALLSVLFATTIPSSIFELDSNASVLIRMLSIALVVSVSIWTLASPRMGGTLGKVRPLMFALFALLGLAGVSTIVSIDRSTSGFQVLALAALVLMVYAGTRERWPNRRDAMSDIALVQSYLAATVILSALTAVAGVPGVYLNGRFQGIYSNPNTIAIVVSILLPISVGLWGYAAKWRLVVGGMTGFIVLLLSGSRTTAIALVVAFGIYCLFGAGKRLHLGAFLLVGAVAAVVAVLVLGASGGRVDRQNLFFRLAQSDDERLLSGREVIWSDTISAALSRPLLGFGYGTAPPEINSIGLIAEDGRRGIATNSYLQVFVETGVIGLVIVIIVALLLLRIAVLNLRSGSYAAFSVAVLSGVLVQLTESALFGAGNLYAWCYWVVVGCLLSLGENERSAGRVRLPVQRLHSPH